jgi:protein-S-isoprenylcysteine O-methyltransferase Ste14
LESLAAHIIRACWLIFALIWLAAAFTSKRSVYRESRWQRLRYSLLLFAGCILLWRGYRYGYPLDLRVVPANDFIACASAILCVAGLLFCFWARATLGRNWSGTITLKEGHELIVRGPYRMVRHPIYTGLLAMLIANAMLVGHIAGILGTILAFVSLWIKLNHEEDVMVQQFGNDYVTYQRRAKRIVPFIL